MASTYNKAVSLPLGIECIQKAASVFCPTKTFNRNAWFRCTIVALTFLTYTCYHMNRKCISVVKNELHRNCSSVSGRPPNSSDTWCDWAPFDGDDASTLLGFVDSSFLFAYAAAMFVSGLVAERVNLRYFLALGMICSGVAGYLLGIAKYYNIHVLYYFIIVQVFGGISQTTGWPGVVAVMGNWFGKGKRGFIYGVWNSHTSIGNILGTVIASAFVETNWGLSFIVPGVIIASAGILNFLFLVPHPDDVNCVIPQQNRPDARPKVTNSSYQQLPSTDDDEGESINSDEGLSSPDGDIVRTSSEGRPILQTEQESKPIGFIGALRIPGVVEFSLCLFFAKLVSYTFLYWLPLYIKNSTTLGASASADVSTVFDIGGIIGGIVAGLISDYSGKNACTCAVMLIIAVPVLEVYNLFGATSIGLNMFLLVVTGILVNGPYALITTAVSAELGTHHSLQGNGKALATVTAIIDGTGSIGAALGPLLAGAVSELGWGKVFYMLMASDIFALLLLVRLVKRELMPSPRAPTPEWQA